MHLDVCTAHSTFSLKCLKANQFLMIIPVVMQLAEAAKAQFSRDYSDHLALVRAYDGWKNAEKEFAGYDYCWKNFLSVQSMKAIESLRREFHSLLKDTGLVDDNESTFNSWSHEDKLVRAVICYGLYPGICSVVVSSFRCLFQTFLCFSHCGQLFFLGNLWHCLASRCWQRRCLI